MIWTHVQCFVLVPGLYISFKLGVCPSYKGFLSNLLTFSASLFSLRLPNCLFATNTFYGKKIFNAFWSDTAGDNSRLDPVILEI